jgi:hypothetical protein
VPHMVPAAELAAVDVQLITLRVSWGKLANLVAGVPSGHRLFASDGACHDGSSVAGFGPDPVPYITPAAERVSASSAHPGPVLRA